MLHILFFPAEKPADELRLRAVLADSLSEIPHTLHICGETLPHLQGQRILFALPLGEFGINLNYQKFLLHLRQSQNLLQNSVAGLIVDSKSTLYSKSAAAELTLAANLAGCAFVGRPLVEGVDCLENFHIQADVLGKSLEEAYTAATCQLCKRLVTYSPIPVKQPKLLVLHAATHSHSNSIDLWEGVKSHLADGLEIQEICLRNGTLSDCSGCAYTTCLHFGEQGGCFYGGVMQESVYPAVRWADAILLVCPNYNDAMSANLTAFVNRLTALFRQTRFYDKSVFAIVVSGYSGSDIVARQIISAMNMNKSFALPPHFAMIERANSPGEALKLVGIQSRISDFSQNMLDCLCDSN